MKDLSTRPTYRSIQKREPNSIGSNRPNLPEFPFTSGTTHNKELFLFLVFIAICAGSLIAWVSEYKPENLPFVGIPLSGILFWGLRKGGLV